MNPEFASLEDFKPFVNAVHEQEMDVILDWVANHTAWDHHRSMNILNGLRAIGKAIFALRPGGICQT